MKTILLPTDFSENSWNAIEYAFQLCQNWECTFYVLNVQKQSEFILDDLVAAPANSNIHNAIIKDNNDKLTSLLAKIKKHNTNKKHRFSKLFDFNNLTSAIKNAVVEKNIDLIIMGSNGATGAKEVVFGSNTLNTIRKVECPILTIPENYKFSKIDSILFTTENGQDFNKNGIKPLLDILKAYNASLSVINLDFANYSNSAINLNNSLKTLFAEQPYTFKTIKEVPSPMVISTLTQFQDYNIHALFVKSKSFLERFIYGSITNEISYNTTVPLLTLR